MPTQRRSNKRKAVEPSAGANGDASTRHESHSASKQQQSSDESQPLYSVILPTYNERRNLPLIVEMLRHTFVQHALRWQCVIVDDNSPDQTGRIADQLARVMNQPSENDTCPEDSQHITVIKRAGKLGLGSAYRAGLAACRGEFVVLMDADFSHHPQFIPEMIALQQRSGVDIVTGSRYIDGGGVHGWDLRRKLTSRVANYIASTLVGNAASDLTGSFRLYKRPVIDHVMECVHSKGYVFQMEIMVRARALHYTVAELPITFVDRLYGESKLGTNEILQYLSGLFKLFWTV